MLHFLFCWCVVWWCVAPVILWMVFSVTYQPGDTPTIVFVFITAPIIMPITLIWATIDCFNLSLKSLVEWWNRDPEAEAEAEWLKLRKEIIEIIGEDVDTYRV